MKPLILIVEDEPPLIEILKYNFEDAGFRTSLATDGDEGILKAQEEVPDLIIPVSYTHLTLPTKA